MQEPWGTFTPDSGRPKDGALLDRDIPGPLQVSCEGGHVHSCNLRGGNCCSKRLAPYVLHPTLGTLPISFLSYPTSRSLTLD